jgi:hypothetical protein
MRQVLPRCGVWNVWFFGYRHSRESHREQGPGTAGIQGLIELWCSWIRGQEYYATVRSSEVAISLFYSKKSGMKIRKKKNFYWIIVIEEFWWIHFRY